MVVAYGINGVLGPTHGERHMGTTLSAIASVLEMVEICQGHVKGSLDSGRRWGSDVRGPWACDAPLRGPEGQQDGRRP